MEFVLARDGRGDALEAEAAQKAKSDQEWVEREERRHLGLVDFGHPVRKKSGA